MAQVRTEPGVSPGPSSPLAAQAVTPLVLQPPPALGYRAPQDDPRVGAGSVLQAAVAICLGGASLLMVVPGLIGLLNEISRPRWEGPRVAAGFAVVLLALGGLAASAVTARDYLSGRNARRRQRRR